MKKLIFTFFLLAGISASSVMGQSLQIIDESSNIISNGTIFHTWEPAAVAIDGIYVKNISSSTVTIKVKKIENSLISGAKCSMCFAGQCFLPSTFISPTQSTLTPNSIDTTFVGDYNPMSNPGESIVTFVFFNIANTNDSAWIVAHFNYSLVGITESTSSKVEVSNPYPNPAVNFTTFNYSFPQNTVSAKFVLNDLLGSKIIETPIFDQNGKLTVNTNEIESGVYFYSFYVNDKLILTKKLIIQH